MESFECTGYFWLPDSPSEEFPGTLKFDHQDGPVLTLISKSISLSDPSFKLSEELPIILGKTTRGPVTLVHNLVPSWSRHHASLTTFTIVSSMILEGCQFKEIDEIVFSSVKVSYSYLVDWAHKPLLEEQLAKPFPLDDIEPNINLKKANLSLWHYRSTASGLYRTAVQRAVSISIEPYDCFSLDEYYLYFNYHLRNFFTLATEKVNHPVDILASLEDNPLPIRIYYQVRDHFEKSRDIFPHEMLFSLDDVKDELAACFSNWIDESDAYSKAHIQYFKTRYQGCLDVETKFLFLAQALEAFHRAQTGKKNEIAKALNGICCELARDNAVLLDKLLPRPRRKEFIKQIVKTRHGLSHAEQKPTAISSGLEFWQYNQRMTILAQICFLRQMGLPNDKITQLFLNNQMFNFITEESDNS